MRVKDAAKKKAIRNVTLEVVDQQGFAGIKMANLAKRIGVSVSTLYVYYKSKEDLIQSLAIELIQEVTKESQRSLDLDLPFKRKLFELWKYWLQFSLENRREASFLEQLKQSPYYEKLPVAVREEKMKMGADLFELGKSEGLIKDVDNLILASIAGSILKESVKLITEGKVERTQRGMDVMFSLFWDAIKS